MIDMDTLKLERDGQLWYGRPNALRIKQARCAENEHDDEWIEYRGGDKVCMGCLAVVGRTPWRLR